MTAVSRPREIALLLGGFGASFGPNPALNCGFALWCSESDLGTDLDRLVGESSFVAQGAGVARWLRFNVSSLGLHPVFGQEVLGDKFSIFAEVLDLVPLPAFACMEIPGATVPPANGLDELKGFHECSNGRLGSSWSSHDYLVHQVGQAADTRAVHQS